MTLSFHEAFMREVPLLQNTQNQKIKSFHLLFKSLRHHMLSLKYSKIPAIKNLTIFRVSLAWFLRDTVNK